LGICILFDAKKEHEIADVCSEINARQMLKKCAPRRKNEERGDMYQTKCVVVIECPI
jgi:hypothetical protein